MRRGSYAVSRSAAMLALLVFGAADWAAAGPLNPLDFTSLGAFPSATGMYLLNTSGTPTLSGPGGTFTGVVSNGVAVFDFNSIDVVSGQVINGTGSLPAALLSRGDITVGGTIDVSAPGGFNQHGGPGGFDGGAFGPGSPGSGPGGGGAGGFAIVDVPIGQPPFVQTIHYSLFGGGGGGGFGGPGNAGTPATVPGGAAPGVAAGGSGGRAYANLLNQLQGGSGGGVGLNAPGGGGGGAIELGAVGKISITGSILANGGSAPGFGQGGGGGGGAGGGILLHGEGVTLSGLLSAIGGGGGSGGSFEVGHSPFDISVFGAGGNGGGGEVFIDPGASGFTNKGGTIDVGNGTFSVVPEPASLVLLGLGLIGVLVCARYAGRLRAV